MGTITIIFSMVDVKTKRSLSSATARSSIGPDTCLLFFSMYWTTIPDPIWFCCLICMTFASLWARSLFICCLYRFASREASRASVKASASNWSLFWVTWRLSIFSSASISWFPDVLPFLVTFSVHRDVWWGLYMGSRHSTMGLNSSW